MPAAPTLKEYRIECGECGYVLMNGEFQRRPEPVNGTKWRCPICQKMVLVEVVEGTAPAAVPFKYPD